jgi:hypothetical protein
MIRQASMKDAVQVARLLERSLRLGVDAGFSIDRQKLLTHVRDTIGSANGFARVVEQDGDILGCFMAEMTPHAYCKGNVINELGVYLDPSIRGGRTFINLLGEFTAWSEIMPDVLITGFTIGQLSATTPYVRRMLHTAGYTKGSEGYYKL